MTALDEAGRLEAIWFAFTEVPWLKVWSVAPTRPRTSHRVTSPYNYPFSRPPGPRSPSPYAARRGRRPPPRS